MIAQYKIVLIIIIGLCSFGLNYLPSQSITSHTNESIFEKWKIQFGVQYSSSSQHFYRQRIFMKNLAQIEQHNAKLDKKYTQGVNQFTDLTQQQFRNIYLGLLPQSNEKRIISISEIMKEEKTYLENLKLDVDWRSRGMVTPIKNQGKCGSCWAFSTTGGLQGFYKLIKGTLVSFSQQQLLDCSSGYGNMGCNGGFMTHAYQYVKDRGITTQQNYPYAAVQQSCKNITNGFKIGGHQKPYSCQSLAIAITRLPISVGVDATNWSKYQSGVFGDCGINMNHGVTLVGISDGNWVVKNSWGTTWGQSGYIRLKPGNTCGICDTSSYPTN